MLMTLPDLTSSPYRVGVDGLWAMHCAQWPPIIPSIVVLTFNLNRRLISQNKWKRLFLNDTSTEIQSKV